MIYKLIGNSTIELEDGRQFAIGLKWIEPIVRGNKFIQKVKLSQKLAEFKIATGVELFSEDGLVQAAGISQDEQKGKVSLALYVSSFLSTNTLVFARVEEDTYWVIMKNNDGSIETTSDIVMDSADLEHYIHERLRVCIGSETLRIINIGGDFQFDDFELNDKLEHKTNLIPFDNNDYLKEFQVKALSANFNQKLIGCVGLMFAGVLGGGYYYITTELPEILQIEQGYYSGSFNSKYSSVSRSYSAIMNANRAGAMNKELFVREAQKQYNEFILSYPEDSLAPFRVLLDMKDKLPSHVKGWYKSKIAYTDGKYYVSYERLGSWPSSSDFLSLDEELVKGSVVKGVEMRPLRILNDGNMRLYEYYVPKEYSDAYLNFTKEERVIAEKKSSVIAKITEQKKQLDSIRSSIQETQNSVHNLNLLDRKDPLIAQNIISTITQDVSKSKEPIKTMKGLVDEYDSIGEVPVPMHESTLLKENGIEDLLYPMLQRMPFIERTQPKEDGGFPQGIDDRFFSNKTYISRNLIDVKFKMPLREIGSASKLLNQDYVFLRNVVVSLPREGVEEVGFAIFTHELNRDYAFLNK